MLTLHQTKISDFLYLRGPIIEMNRYPVTKDKPNFKPSLPHCSLRTADAFPVVGSLPPKNSVALFRKIATLFFGGREQTTGNASAIRRLTTLQTQLEN